MFNTQGFILDQNAMNSLIFFFFIKIVSAIFLDISKIRRKKNEPFSCMLTILYHTPYGKCKIDKFKIFDLILRLLAKRIE